MNMGKFKKPGTVAFQLNALLLALLSPTISNAEVSCGVQGGNIHHYTAPNNDKFTCTVFSEFQIGPNFRTTDNNAYAIYSPTIRIFGPVSIADGDTLILGSPNKKRLNDTGIVDCSDPKDAGLACPVDFYPGQDAEFGRDKDFDYAGDGAKGFSYTDVDRNGGPWINVPGDEDPSGVLQPTCIKDNVTGLIWERKVTTVWTDPVDDSEHFDLRHKDNRYTWYNSDPLTNGGNPGQQNGGYCGSGGILPTLEDPPLPAQPVPSCDTQSYIAALNTYHLCGMTGWRLPTRSELRSLADYSKALPGPLIDTGFFPNTEGKPYWSSNPDPFEMLYSWVIDFGYGEINWDFKTHYYRIRAVHDPL